MPTVGAARQLHGSASLQAIYDSNFARSSKAAAAIRGIEPEEVTLRPQVNLNVVQPFGRQVVFLQGSAGYDFHRNNEDLDRGRADVQGGYLASLGLCQVGLTSTYRAAQSDLATIDTERTKNLAQAVGTGATASCGRATGFAGTVSVQRVDAKNSADLQKTADSTHETLQTTLIYGHPTLGKFGLVYAYSSSEFPNRIIPGRPIGDGFWTQTYGLSAERSIGSRLKVNGQVGQTKVKREFAPVGTPQKFTSTSYAANASYRFGDRLLLQLQGARAVRPTGRAGKLYDIDTNGQITGRYSFGTRYVASLGYGISDVESNDDTLGARPVVTDSRTHTVFGSIRYRQSTYASLLLDVRYDDRDTNLPDFNYSSTRVGLSAEVGF